jgi:hypothetical protein
MAAQASLSEGMIDVSGFIFGRGPFLVMACALATACASGSSRSTGGGIPLPENNRFDGGTSATGDFMFVPSAVEDSVLQQPRNRIWAVLPAVFETLEVRTPTVNAPAYLIGNPSTRISRLEGRRLSTFLNCGSGVLGPNADRYDVTLQLMVQLAPNPEGGTVVRTTLDAYAEPRDVAGEPLHCASQRTLEGRIMELIQAELDGAGPRGPARTVAQGRVPNPGDFLRLECSPPSGAEQRVGEGFFAGGGDGLVRLDLGTAGSGVEIPASSIGRVQVRERRSRTRLGAFIVGVAGGVAGGILGKGFYDPDVKNVHYGSGVYTAGGAIIGLIGGAIVGGIAGSFVSHDLWHDAPRDWAMRYEGSSSPAGATEAAGAGCAGFDPIR